MRIIFMGTPELACASLRALLSAPDFQVVAAVTQPDRPKGRDLKLQPSPVKVLALASGVPVLQPQRARDEAFISQMRELNPDLIAVAAFGQILPKAILDIPPLGCFNVHTSLLPRYRGAAPIQWAILNDDAETGVTIMKMDVGLDTGDILAVERTPITAEDTSETLHDRLATMGAELLVDTIRRYSTGQIQPVPQTAEGVTLAPRIKKEDGHIDWSKPARQVWNRIRGLRPWPGAFTFMPASGATTQGAQLLKLWRADIAEQTGEPGDILSADRTGIVVGCGHDALKITELQREGGRRLTAQQFLAGHPLKPGEKLG